MRTYKESFKMFKYNMPSVILFEITIKIVAAAFVIPLFYSVVNLSVKLAGISFLSKYNLKQYVTSPSTYALIFLFLMVMSVYILINISGLIYAMEASHRREKVGVIRILVKGTLNALRVLNPKNWGILIYVLFILPAISSVMLSGSLTSVRAPEFLVVLMNNKRTLVEGLILLYLFIAVIAVFRIFSLNFFTLYKVDYKEANRLGKKLIKRRFIGVFLGLLIFNIVLNAILYLLQGALAAALAGILGKIVPYKAFKFSLQIGAQIIFTILYIICSLVAVPLILSFICCRFYELEGDAGYNEFLEVKKKRKRHIEKEQSPEEKKIRDRVAFWVVLVIALALNGVYLYLGVSNRANLSILYPTRASVTAHRGDSGSAPENTMSAIKLAYENQADIIEIDIRQTSDGRFVLMHDENLKRTTGIDKKVGHVDYEYIQMIDAGKKFAKEFEGEHIPTLEEVLEYGKEHHIIYNIELKPASTDKDYVQGVIRILEEYDYIDDCVVASVDYDLLKELKETNEEIKTVYILSIVIGDVSGMEYADIFSVRHNFVTRELVEQIHHDGKQIYAWTVNSEEDIKKLLMLDVDSVITDNPYQTKDIIYNANSNIIMDYIQRLIKEY